MAEVITMPKLGFDMAEGILVRWIKAEDEQVEKGEVLAEIETDKATVEVESIISGVVRKHDERKTQAQHAWAREQKSLWPMRQRRRDKGLRESKGLRDFEGSRRPFPYPTLALATAART